MLRTHRELVHSFDVHSCPVVWFASYIHWVQMDANMYLLLLMKLNMFNQWILLLVSVKGDTT